jgi:hypothetical protein
MPVLRRWIENSPFIKRDYKKIIQLVKVITLINYKRREMWVDDHHQYLITHPEDILLLYQILKEYMTSLALNIPKTLIEFYMKLKEAAKQGKLNEEFTIHDVRAVIDVSNISNLSQILTRLRDVRLLDVVKSEGEGKKQVNLYKMGSVKITKIEPGEFEISPKTRQLLKYEHSPGLLVFLDDQLRRIDEEVEVEVQEWVMPNYMPPEWEWSEFNPEVREVKLRAFLEEKDDAEVIPEDGSDDVEDEVVSDAVKKFQAML